MQILCVEYPTISIQSLNSIKLKVNNCMADVKMIIEDLKFKTDHIHDNRKARK